MDQVRKELEGQPVNGTTTITEDQREFQELKAKFKRMEMEADIVKKATALLMSDPDRVR